MISVRTRLIWIERNPLRMHRKANRLTTRAMGEVLKVSYQSINKWESGECWPNCKSMEKLAPELGFQPNGLELVWKIWFEGLYPEGKKNRRAGYARKAKMQHN